MKAARKNAGNRSRELLVCHHCANTVRNQRIGVYRGRELFENIDGRKFYEDFICQIYRCPTCHGISIYGDFKEHPKFRTVNERRIYPPGPCLLPAAHKLASTDCVPDRITKLYEEIWPLRHIAPSAFAGQIRRVLEFICHDQKARGKNLAQQLKDLVTRGALPGHFAETTDLMRHIGNLGAHAGEKNIDFWDAELLDDFFRFVVEYVYIAPSRIERLKRRLGDRKGSKFQAPPKQIVGNSPSCIELPIRSQNMAQRR